MLENLTFVTAEKVVSWNTILADIDVDLNVVVTKNRWPLAVIISIDEYEEYRELQGDEDDR